MREYTLKEHPLYFDGYTADHYIRDMVKRGWLVQQMHVVDAKNRVYVLYYKEGSTCAD